LISPFSIVLQCDKRKNPDPSQLVGKIGVQISVTELLGGGHCRFALYAIQLAGADYSTKNLFCVNYSI
jgi:hypothetical protein